MRRRCPAPLHLGRVWHAARGAPAGGAPDIIFNHIMIFIMINMWTPEPPIRSSFVGLVIDFG